MSRVDEIMQSIDRADFMPAQSREFASMDRAFGIGYGQTISQPYTVGKMLHWLNVKPGQKVLDVGSGSGWTTALLSLLVGDKGSVHAVERVPELLAFGKENCQKYQLKNVHFHQAGKTLGYKKAAPYDRILVSAAAQELPSVLLDQLGEEGKMVVPLRSDILEVDRAGRGKIIVHEGFIFVPLIED